MNLLSGILCVLLLHTTKAQWSWDQDLQTAASENIQQNTTDVEKVVDEILVSTRQGRALDGFDEVYSDPTVQEAIQKGDEGEARNIIKDRLCYLGLMQCDEEIEGKRPYIAPEELQYAQPVAINPVGRPIPTIPIKGGRGTYGPPRPVGVPLRPPSKYPGNLVNKPPRRNYGPSYPGNLNYKPTFGEISKPPFLAGGEILAEGEFLDKPPSGDYFNKIPSPGLTVPQAPYQFETVQGQKDKRVEITVNAQGGVASATAASVGDKVEHVHHHYHHNADNKPTVVVNPIPVAAAAVSTSFESSSNSFSSANSNGFIPGTGGLPLSPGASYGGQSSANYGPQTFGSSTGLGTFGSSNSFGSSGGYYGGNDLYKKELNVGSVNNNYLGSNYAEKFQGVESARAENYDCVCVPYEQCPTHDVIGRKDDLYLAIDPRNLKSDIEAETDNAETRVITDGNGTMTVVRVAKDTTNASASDVEDDQKEEKKLVKREAPVEEKKEEDDDHKIEGRQYQSQIANQYGDLMKKLKPTFGISFGLPYQGGGGYPFSPQNIYPNHGTVTGTGVNLGLISVNPLLSVQFTKDDYGNKVIKPLVNLHVTPNSYLVSKFEDLVSYKKGVIYNKHKHLHVHKGYDYPPPHYEGPYREHPDEFHHGEVLHRPEIYHGVPQFHHPQFDGPDFHDQNHFDGPPHHSSYGPPHYEGPEYHDQQYIPDYDSFSGRAYPTDNITFSSGSPLQDQYQEQYNEGYANYGDYNDKGVRGGKSLRLGGERGKIAFPSSRRRRDVNNTDGRNTKRQAYYGRPQTCGPRHVCCRKPVRPQPTIPKNTCGTRHSQGINGRIKNPVYVDGDSEFGEYPWQVAILKKDPKESVYVCGGTLIDPLHIITAAHCVKQYTNFDLRVRLGEWDVNHDVEFYPYIERDIAALTVHPEFYAGTLANDIAILRMNTPVDFNKHPHISPACLPHPNDDYTGSRCWTTGWGKDAFGDFGKYQNILKEVDVPIVGFNQCQRQLQNTRLGYEFRLHPGFVCAGGEEGKDACKGDGGGPMVCERGGTWQVVGVVSWGIGCGQVGVPGVYAKVAHYLDWIRQVTLRY